MEENTILDQAEEQAEVAIEPRNGNIMFDDKAMKRIFGIAKAYANSKMIPVTYQGKPDDCLVAVMLAARMNVDPVVVMNWLYVVQGRPSWSGQGCVALINGSGQFSPLEFVQIGERGTPSWGCYCQATRRSDGAIIKGTAITMQMAQDFGWLTKKGSMWKLMPEQMLKYRAAAFFARTECPNVLFGYSVEGEVEDVYGAPTKEKIVLKLED